MGIAGRGREGKVSPSKLGLQGCKLRDKTAGQGVDALGQNHLSQINSLSACGGTLFPPLLPLQGLEHIGEHVLSHTSLSAATGNNLHWVQEVKLGISFLTVLLKRFQETMLLLHFVLRGSVHSTGSPKAI